MFSRRKAPKSYFQKTTSVINTTDGGQAGKDSFVIARQQEKKILEKMLKVRVDLLVPFKLENLILRKWLDCGGGSKYSKELARFACKLKEILDQHHETHAYEVAVFGDNPVTFDERQPEKFRYNQYAKKGLRLYGETSHLSELLRRCPALSDFLYKELCEKSELIAIQLAYKQYLAQLANWIVLKNIFIYMEKNKNKMVHPQAWHNTARVGFSLDENLVATKFFHNSPHVEFSPQNTHNKCFYVAPLEYEEALNGLLNSTLPPESSLENSPAWTEEYEEYEEALNTLLSRQLPFDFNALKLQIVSQRIMKLSQLQRYNEEKRELEKIMLQAMGLPAGDPGSKSNYARPRR